MINKWQFYTIIAIIVFALTSTTKKSDVIFIEGFHVSDEELTNHHILTETEYNFQNFEVPYTGKSFAGFKQALAFKESQGNYKRINTIGYMGKYQFGKSTLEIIGIRDSIAFMNSPKLQEKAFMGLLSYNKYVLKNIIQKYEGQEINGVLITESGILAAAHLGGAGAIKRYLKTNGRSEKKDAYGTSLKSYLIKFGGYDTSVVEAKKRVRISLS